MVTEAREEQSPKAVLLMLLTPFSIVTDWRDVQY
ncbi:hypothetical protein Barb6_02962 [Bacteroidales bacterium Barb6]|nr:hypothetical protein Barb6_02962 [Bacteroidales bacterium Barb6]